MNICMILCMVITSTFCYCSENDFELDIDFYYNMRKKPHNIHKISPKAYKKLLYTTQYMYNNHNHGEKNLKKMAPFFIKRLICSYKNDNCKEGIQCEKDLLSFIKDNVPDCKRHMLEFMKKYFHIYNYNIKNNSIEEIPDDIIYSTRTVLVREYNKKRPTKIIDFGALIRNLKKEKKNKKKLYEKRDTYQKELNNIHEKIYSKQIEQAKLGYYNRLKKKIDEEINLLQSKKKGIELKIKTINDAIEAVNFSFDEIHFASKGHPWGEIICNENILKTITYFSSIQICNKYKEEGGSLKHCGYSCFVKDTGELIQIKTTDKKLMQYEFKDGYSSGDNFLGIYKYGPYTVYNKKSRQNCLFAELQKDNEIIFSEKYDNKNYQIVISPNGSEIACIDLNEKMIKVYDMYEKEIFVEEDSNTIEHNTKEKNRDNTSFLQVYKTYKNRLLVQ